MEVMGLAIKKSRAPASGNKYSDADFPLFASQVSNYEQKDYNRIRVLSDYVVLISYSRFIFSSVACLLI